MAKAKSKSFIARAVQYLAGGTLYFWVGYGLFALAFSVFGWSWFWAKVLGDIVGRSVNYIVQRYVAFDDTDNHESTHVSRYTIISVMSIVIDYSIVAALNEIGLSPYVGQIISAAFFTAWNYLWFKYWVFVHKKPSRNST